ncbi:MAG: FAD:protein FMN transferase [Candidatus Dadabacteria bacterium]|nr:MAG: FAD:protein FMN transferase [Candidatus Dadabacteria bacterium]
MRMRMPVVAAALVLTAPVFAARDARGEAEIVRARYLMGTRLELTIVADLPEAADAAAEQVFRIIAEQEAILSNWRTDSPVSRFNRALRSEQRKLARTKLLEPVLEAAASCVSATAGDFSPLIEPLSRIWEIRSGGADPGPIAIRRARRRSSPRALQRLVAGRRARRIELDTGGFGKGYALDLALRSLHATTGVQTVVANFGGQIAVWPEDQALAASVADPLHRERAVAALAVNGGSVATSGGIERLIKAHGEGWTTIINPRTGWPVEPWGTVTAWADNATLADCYSTAAFAAGPVDAPIYARKHPEAGFIIVRATPNGYDIQRFGKLAE